VIRRTASALAFAALLLPAAALACPVCSQSTGRNANAFRGTTALLSLLPLTMFVGGIWWLRKKGYGAGEFVDRDEQQGGDAPPK
jgi:hypothetical protein